MKQSKSLLGRMQITNKYKSFKLRTSILLCFQLILVPLANKSFNDCKSNCKDPLERHFSELPNQLNVESFVFSFCSSTSTTSCTTWRRTPQSSSQFKTTERRRRSITESVSNFSIEIRNSNCLSEIGWSIVAWISPKMFLTSQWKFILSEENMFF